MTITRVHFRHLHVRKIIPQIKAKIQFMSKDIQNSIKNSIVEISL